MASKWYHILLLLAIGYALGFWLPTLGNVTLAKVYPRG